MGRKPVESELIDLVEDNLGPARHARRMTALDDQTKELVEALRRDRDRLRSLEEPALPHDIVATLESRLARPMLLETTPGAYRRRHRRARWPKWVAMGAAASLLLAVALVAAMVWTNRPVNSIVHAPEDVGDPVRGPAPTARVASGLPATTDRVREAAPNALVTAAPVTVVAPFTLVVDAKDDVDAEAILIAATTTLAEPRICFVRNFTEAEAVRLTQRQRISTDSDAPLVAGLDEGSDPRKNGRRTPPRRPRDVAAETGHESALESAMLVGDETIGPDYEEQLALSGQGALYTITVPVNRLGDLLRDLRLEHALSTRLVPHDRSEGDDLTPVQRWVEDLRVLQPLVESMRRHPDGLAHVPIVFQD